MPEEAEADTEEPADEPEAEEEPSVEQNVEAALSEIEPEAGPQPEPEPEPAAERQPEPQDQQPQEAPASDGTEESYIDDILNEIQQEVSRPLPEETEADDTEPLPRTYDEELAKAAEEVASPVEGNIDDLLNDITPEQQQGEQFAAAYEEEIAGPIQQEANVPPREPDQPPVEEEPRQPEETEAAESPEESGPQREIPEGTVINQYPHLSVNKVRSIMNQVNAMKQAIGDCEKVDLQHYVTFEDPSSFAIYRTFAEAVGMKVDDLNEQNETYIYSTLPGDEEALTTGILSLADSVSAYNGRYHGWRVTSILTA
jgi:hypothetical protein